MYLDHRSIGLQASQLEFPRYQRLKAFQLKVSRLRFFRQHVLSCNLCLAGTKQEQVRAKRQEMKIEPSYKRVDTCAAEFEAATPYMYSSYDGECESMPTDKPKVLILGGGPNRIGQGIEFDYCCCHASFALRYCV